MPIEFIPCKFPLNRTAAAVDGSAYLEIVRRLHQALAGPDLVVQMPADPAGADADHEATIAYWEALLYLLTVLTGWTNVGKGLTWFYQGGLADEGDARLRLVREVWNSDGQLALFAAFAYTGLYNYNMSFEQLNMAYEGVGYRRLDDRRYTGTPEWQADFEQRRIELLRRHPFGPEPEHGNALHISRHNSWSIFQNLGAKEVVPLFLTTNPAERQGVLVLEHLTGWYPHLVRFGATLPDLGDRSWHIDVFVKQAGWLGTFRRSRATGLWFQGRHRIHMMGN